MLPVFFIKNLDIVFFIYGFSFVVMGITILVHPRSKESLFRLSDIIWLLAGFGFIHGLNEWLDLFVIMRGYSSEVFDHVRLILLTVSYLFLFEFGRRFVGLTFKAFLSSQVSTVVLSFLVLLLINIPEVDKSIWPRYFLGLPGGLLTGAGFIFYYRSNEALLRPLNVRRYFFFSAFSSIAYAVLGGLVTPKANFFPANWINTLSFLNLVGIPVQVFRAICSVILASYVWNLLNIFNWEIKQKLEKSLEEVASAKSYVDDIIKSMVDTLIVVGLDGKIKTVTPSATALFGYQESEIVGQPVTTLFAEGELSFEGSRMVKLVKRGFLRDYETVSTTKAGEKIPVSFSGSIMRNNRGEVTGIVAIVKDIREIKRLMEEEKKVAAAIAVARTERTKAEELTKAYTKLEEMQDMLIQAEKINAVGQLASGVAHEIRNPLAIVVQGADFLDERIIPKEKDIAEIIKMIQNNVKKADNIVSTLLDFSKATRLTLKPEDINVILEDSLLLVRYPLKDRNIEIKKELNAGMPKVLADKEKLEQVFINIFLNAIQSMPDRGEISIRSYPTQLDKPGNGAGIMNGDSFKPGERAVIVEIKDTGAGIRKEYLNKIFDPFFTTKGPKGGTGLGLAVTKNIISRHGGLIHINSYEGKGTNVIITLRIHR